MKASEKPHCRINRPNKCGLFKYRIMYSRMYSIYRKLTIFVDGSIWLLQWGYGQWAHGGGSRGIRGWGCLNPWGSRRRAGRRCPWPDWRSSGGSFREKSVVGTLARAVRAELGKVLVSILKLKIILNIIYKVPPLLLNLCKKCCIYVNNCKWLLKNCYF